MIEITNEDNMALMSRYPDAYFDLAICDIPYGIKVGNMAFLQETKTTVKQKNGTRLNGNRNKKPYLPKKWDEEPPPQAYFDELRRVSKHQIIFGVEYVNWDGLGPGRIKWKKGVPDGVSFKEFEKAYCSLIDYEIELPLLWSGMMQAKSLSEPMTQQGNKKLNEKRIHPTQKPVLLYKRILLDFAKPGFKILDTHFGSLSIGLACDELGFDLWACEIDKDYFEAARKRYLRYKAQLKMEF